MNRAVRNPSLIGLTFDGLADGTYLSNLEVDAIEPVDVHGRLCLIRPGTSSIPGHDVLAEALILSKT
jgi:hypothetical protein